MEISIRPMNTIFNSRPMAEYIFCREKIVWQVAKVATMFSNISNNMRKCSNNNLILRLTTWIIHSIKIHIITAIERCQVLKELYA